jgi:uncharacterized membrane protein YccC
VTRSLPPWLAEVGRLATGPVPWAQMVKAALAVGVPLALGILTGQPVAGLLGSIGGLLAALVDPGGPYLLRARRMAVALLAGAVPGLIVGSLIHGQGWLAVVVLVLVAGVSALLSTAGSAASVTGLQLLVYCILGTGPLATIRPWWVPAAGALAGGTWGILLLAPGWLLTPQAPEQHRIAAAYQALAAMLRAIGTGEYPARRQAVTAALNTAYDEVAARRATESGRNLRLERLVALLAQTHPLAEAAATLADEGRRPPAAATAVLDAAAGAVEGGEPVPAPPRFPAASAGERALLTALTDLAGLLSGRGAAGQPVPGPPAGQRAGWRERLRAAVDQIAAGHLVVTFAIRVMVCVGAAAVVSEALPLQRSYWVPLTVAIVLRPDFGSVFARGLQRGIGTVIGAVAGAVILAVVPYGPLLLLPCAVLAGLLPYGRSRNYGLVAVFLTPLVVVLIDLLTAAGWRLAEDRLIDTLIGCAIALLVGYAPWPAAWHAHLPGQFAATVDKVSRYTEQALLIRSPDRPGQRRQTYRALSDLRAEFQRTLAEPPAVSRRAARLWPALAALESVMDKVTATAVRVNLGASPPPAGEVVQVTAALEAIAAAAGSGTTPPALPLPTSGSDAIRPVAAAVREMQRSLAAGRGK